jgi:membrane protein required for colicin V production
MNYLDYAILIGAALFTLLGIYWGLIRQVLALAGLLVGVAMAGRYGPDVAAWLSSFIADPLLAGALGFLAVLLLVSAAASLVASMLRVFAGLLFLGWLDHLLGGVLGLIQAIIGAAVILIVMITFPLPAWSSAVAESRLAEGLLSVGGVLSPLLPEIFRRALGM